MIKVPTGRFNIAAQLQRSAHAFDTRPSDQQITARRRCQPNCPIRRQPIKEFKRAFASGDGCLFKLGTNIDISRCANAERLRYIANQLQQGALVISDAFVRAIDQITGLAAPGDGNGVAFSIVLGRYFVDIAGNQQVKADTMPVPD